VVISIGSMVDCLYDAYMQVGGIHPAEGGMGFMDVEDGDGVSFLFLRFR